MSHANVFHAKVLSNSFFVLDMRTVWECREFVKMVFEGHPVLQVLGWLRRRVGSDLKMRTRQYTTVASEHGWIPTSTRAQKMAGANVRAGPHPFHRAPFGAGRSS
eukprot:73584-Amphidinium_carterae.1